MCYVYFFQVKNIVKSHFLHLQEHHQMLWSTFLWNYQHLYPQVSLLVELILLMPAISAVVERGIKIYLLLYATFLQLRTITLPMQESVIKNLILSSSVSYFSKPCVSIKATSFPGLLFFLTLKPVNVKRENALEMRLAFMFLLFFPFLIACMLLKRLGSCQSTLSCRI